MRTTLTLEPDVVALLVKVRKKRAGSLKRVINEALRQGLQSLSDPPRPRGAFVTKAVRLGPCLVGSLDDVAEALARAEGEAFK